MSVNYFIQANDGKTAELIANKKIKHNSDIKFHPVKVMGAGNNIAWVFIGELLAYDPFTLEKIADREIIETKNPQLKGKMPDEERYYEYDGSSNSILITATDGTKYLLSTANLKAAAVDEDVISKKPVEAKIKALKKITGNHNGRLNQIYVVLENLLDEKVKQKKWEDRDRIGFRK